MKHFVTGKIYFLKTLEVLFILLILCSGLYFFDRNSDLIIGFKPYYIGSYLKAYDIGKEKFDNFPQGIASSVPILMYHGAVGGSDGHNVSADDFANQMIALKKDGWQTINLQDFYLFMQGKKTVPDKSFLLTFDDGRKDSYYPTDPILKVLDYNAVIFVITKYSLEDYSGNYYLSKKELSRMIASGRWEIEAHTRDGHNLYDIGEGKEKTHFYSNKLFLNDKGRIETEEEFSERIRSDFLSAKNDIESELHVPVLGFAFPFGDFGQDSVNFPESKQIILNTIQQTYPMSFYQVRQDSGYTFNYPDPNAFLMKRLEVTHDWNPKHLLNVLQSAKGKTLPFRDNFTSYQGWVKSWGQMAIVDKKLFLGSQSTTTGALVFLDGSYYWKDYRFDVVADFINGQTFSLISRFQDQKNYVSCVYTPEYVRLTLTLDGAQQLIANEKNDTGLLGMDKNIGMTVRGDNVNCLANQTSVVSAQVDHIPAMGGVGVSSWDAEVGNSEMSVKEVTVQ